MDNWKLIYAVAAVGLGLLLVGCERKPDPELIAGHNVLIVTLDTTRADRLGCYGYAKAETPTLDGLAARSALFEQAFSQVPLTLPSHSSIMTGRYPREHGVRDNARNALGDTHATLAEVFKAHGYQTSAFVASFVLDSRFGIGRGFEAFDDDMGEEEKGTQAIKWQLQADEVTDRALAWLKSNATKPFFCWVHYYDPHDPYTPPESFRKPNVLPYDAEIAFTDSQLKRLFDWLESKNLLDRTLVIVVGDHGESFDEHGERGHTNFVYDTNLHVPMFFVHPAIVPTGMRLTTVVEVVDIFPTVLDLFGWDPPRGLLSRSLAPLFVGGELEDRGSYGESLYVLNSFGWAEQRSWTTERWKYISSTKPELFDRRADRGETANVVAANPGVAERMLQELKDRYESMTPGEAESAELSAEDIAALQSLGYTGSTMKPRAREEAFLTENLRDPKDMISVTRRLSLARVLMEGAKKPDDYARVIPLLEGIVEESPDTPLFRHVLAACFMKAGHPEDALPVLEEGLAIDEADVPTIMMRAEILLKLERAEEALKDFEAAALLDPGSAHTRTRCGILLESHGLIEEAIDFFRRATDVDPGALRAHSHLGVILPDATELAEAIEDFREALVGREDDAEMQYNLGLAYFRIGRMAEAIVQFQKALNLKADYCEAAGNLGTALMSAGRIEEAKGVFRRAMTIKGCEAEGRYKLGVAASMGGGDTAETIRLYEEAIALKPTFTPPIEELAQYYVSVGRTADAVRVLKIGAEANEDNARLANDLAHIRATSRDDAIRDSGAAVALGERAAGLTKHRDPYVLGVLAEAYATAGDFDKAISTARRALDLLPADAPPQFREHIAGQLRGYENGKPFRDPRL